MDFILYLSFVGALYGLIKVIYDMVIRKKWRDILRSHEFIILLVSIVIAGCFFIPWSKFHYGDQQVKTVYVDSSKNKPQKQLKTKVHADTPQNTADSSSYFDTTKLKQKHRHIALKVPAIKKVDTTGHAVTQTNQRGDNVSGNKDGHYFNGGAGNQYNAPIVNGNVNVNTTRQLTEGELNSLYNFVEKMRIDSGINKNIEILGPQSVDISETSVQIAQYFKNKGYQTKSNGFYILPPNQPLNNGIGVKPQATNDLMSIRIGKL